MSRWHHGHSLATGAVLGLLVFHAGILWPLTLMFMFGLLVGRLWWRVALGFQWLARRRAPRDLVDRISSYSRVWD